MSNSNRPGSTDSRRRKLIGSATARLLILISFASSVVTIGVWAADDTGSSPSMPTTTVDSPGPTCETGTCSSSDRKNDVIENNLKLIFEMSGRDIAKARSALVDSRIDPVGAGPWPYAVLTGGDLGAYARDRNTAVAHRLGTAEELTVIWADCATISDFTPADASGSVNVGPRWLRIRWQPSVTDVRAVGVSVPDSINRAWMYGGALVPYKHNGNISDCF